MDPLTAITVGSIAAGGIGNIVGAASRSNQLFNPELEAAARRGQEIQDEAARQFMMDQRAQQAGQNLDVQQAAQQTAALMAEQGGFTGREQMNVALELQAQRAQQNARLAAKEAEMAVERARRQAVVEMELAQRETDAQGEFTRGVAGAVGTAAQQGLQVAQTAAAMRAQQSYQQDLLKALARPEGQQMAAAQAQRSFGDAAIDAFGLQDPLEMSDLDLFDQMGADAYMRAQQGQFLGVV